MRMDVDVRGTVPSMTMNCSHGPVVVFLAASGIHVFSFQSNMEGDAFGDEDVAPPDGNIFNVCAKRLRCAKVFRVQDLRAPRRELLHCRRQNASVPLSRATWTVTFTFARICTPMLRYDTGDEVVRAAMIPSSHWWEEVGEHSPNSVQLHYLRCSPRLLDMWIRYDVPEFVSRWSFPPRQEALEDLVR